MKRLIFNIATAYSCFHIIIKLMWNIVIPIYKFYEPQKLAWLLLIRIVSDMIKRCQEILCILVKH